VLDDSTLAASIAGYPPVRRYGSRRGAAELRLGEGIAVPPKRVQRLTRTAGMSGLVARMR